MYRFEENVLFLSKTAKIFTRTLNLFFQSKLMNTYKRRKCFFVSNFHPSFYNYNRFCSYKKNEKKNSSVC